MFVFCQCTYIFKITDHCLNTCSVYYVRLQTFFSPCQEPIRIPWTLKCDKTNQVGRLNGIFLFEWNCNAHFWCSISLTCCLQLGEQKKTSTWKAAVWSRGAWQKNPLLQRFWARWLLNHAHVTSTKCKASSWLVPSCMPFVPTCNVDVQYNLVVPVETALTFAWFFLFAKVRVLYMYMKFKKIGYLCD